VDRAAHFEYFSQKSRAFPRWSDGPQILAIPPRAPVSPYRLLCFDPFTYLMHRMKSPGDGSIGIRRFGIGNGGGTNFIEYGFRSQL